MGKKESALKPLTNACRGILVCLLAALVLAGCMPAASSSVPLPPEGGWVEQEVLTLDVESTYDNASICQQSNGDLWLIVPVCGTTQSEPEIYHSTDDGQSWQRASGWADPVSLPDGVEPKQYAVTTDGVPWMLGVCQNGEGGSGTEQLYMWREESWQPILEESGYWSSQLSVSADGRAVLRQVKNDMTKIVYLISSDGAVETRKPSGDYLLTDGKRMVEWLALGEKWFLDGDRMEEPGGTPLLVKDSALYVWKNNGVQVRHLDGMVWEELLPPQDSPALQLPGVEVTSLAETNEGTLLVATRQPESIRLLRYHYDPNLSHSGEVIQVYSLYEQEDVRYAVAEYLSAHPGAQVSYQTEFTQRASREDVQAAMESLAQQLQSGEGPDLLVLDGMLWDLPLQQLCADGVFCDLSQTLQGKDLVPAARMGQEGPLYTVCCRVELPVLWLPREMQPPKDLEAFARMVESGPRSTAANYDEMYRAVENGEAETPVWLEIPAHGALLLYMTSRPSLLQDGELDTNAMKRLLHKAERMVVLDHPDEVWRIFGWEERHSNWLQGTENLVGAADSKTSRTGLSSTTRMTIRDMFVAFRKPMQPVAAPSLSGKAVYFPRQIVAAPASGNTAAAKELVSRMLEKSTQAKSEIGYYEHGMPVNRAALPDFCADIRTSLSGFAQSPEDSGELEALCALLESADTPVYSDTPVDELAARAVMRALLGQSADDSLQQLLDELDGLSGDKAE